jgi:hypothetical protein
MILWVNKWGGDFVHAIILVVVIRSNDESGYKNRGAHSHCSGAAITFSVSGWASAVFKTVCACHIFANAVKRVVLGWRLVIFGAVLGGVTLAISQYAEPTAYRFFPPSPTVTITPTITETPTISLTPSSRYRRR